MKITRVSRKLERRIKRIKKNNPDDAGKSLTEREISRANEKWALKVKKHFPELAQRVFALRDKHYMGCGFHYDLERNLGIVIASLNDYTTHRRGIKEFAFHSMRKINVMRLFQEIKKAEKSAKELAIQKN